MSSFCRYYGRSQRDDAKKELGRHEKMTKYVIQAKRGAPPAGAYSQGWRAGDFIFVSGTGPIDPVHGGLVGDSIEQQAEQTIDNIVAILQADGASLRDVVKVHVHLSDTSLFARYNAVYARRFSPPYPARTTVGSDLGHAPGMLIEIDCIAFSVKKTRLRPVPGAKKKKKKKKKTKKKANRRNQ
jgi:2-iminobutanoate/2-iminopropanoate deaminase